MNNHGGKRPGSGRPKTGKNTKQICLTLTKIQAKKLEEKAAMYNISISKLIIEGLDLDSEPYIISRKSGQIIQKIANLQYYKSKANYGTKKKGISR